jgi:hypothetical protein
MRGEGERMEKKRAKEKGGRAEEEKRRKGEEVNGV